MILVWSGLKGELPKREEIKALYKIKQTQITGGRKYTISGYYNLYINFAKKEKPLYFVDKIWYNIKRCIFSRYFLVLSCSNVMHLKKYSNSSL